MGVGGYFMVGPRPPDSNAVGRSTNRWLSESSRGILWMLAASVSFAFMPVAIRETTAYMHSMEAAFFRNAVALLLMLPWMVRAGASTFRNAKFGIYTTRAITGTVSMLSWFYGISHLPMGTAQALAFTQPMFATVLAALLLREDVRIRRWSATLVGFLGVVIIVRPGSGNEMGLPEALVLISALCGALSAIQVKALARSQSTASMVAFLALYMTPVSLLVALPVFTVPPVEAWPWIAVLGGVGTIGQICITRAFHLAEASALVPIDYVRLPLAVLLGWWLYEETLAPSFWIGSAVIGLSAVYITHREVQVRREATRRSAGVAGETLKTRH